MTGVNLQLDPEALKPLIEAVVTEALARVEAARADLGERLAYTEAEAAAMIGLNRHQLRDVRQDGKIAASQIVRGRIRYLREDLMAYLLAHRVDANGAR